MYSPNRSFRTAFTLIVVIQLLIALVVIGVGVWALVWVATQDWSHGIQPVIESVWCGKPGCS